MSRFNTRLLFLIPFLIVGCANIPPVIRYPPPENPHLRQVLGNIDAYAGKSVRWGGSIVSTTTKPDATWIEVVAHKLNRYGAPTDLDRSSGRFMVRARKFLDPAVYASGRAITVAGTIDGQSRGSIGQKPYVFPVVKPTEIYLWPTSDLYGNHYYAGYPGYHHYPRYRAGFHFGYGHGHHHGFHFGSRLYPH